MKRVICLLLCLVMALSVLAGCTGGNTDTTNANNQATGGNDSTSGNNDSTSGSDETTTGADDGVKRNKFGIPMHEGVTLTIGIPENANCLDYYDNDYTKWLEENTGIKLKFELYAATAADYQKQLSTDTVAGKKLPDILMGFSLGEDLYNQYGEDGYFLDLSEYFLDEERSKLFWDRMNGIRNDPNIDYSEYVAKIEMMMWSEYRVELGTGAIYGYPTVATSPLDNFAFAPLINTRWLDVVNMPAPTTLEELIAVLRAFKATDCNGDGYPNEIPMMGGKANGDCSDIVSWLVNFFMYERWGSYTALENGQVYTPYVSDTYREALKFINSLVDEGLFYAGSLNYGGANFASILASSDLIGVLVCMPTTAFAGTGDAIQCYTPLDLYGYAAYQEESFSYNTFITENCEDVDAAWDLLMTMSTWESAVCQRWGKEGVNWERSDGTVESCMGIPATVKVVKDVWNTPNNVNWGKLTSTFNTYDTFDTTEVSLDDAYLVKRKEIWTGNYTNFNNAVIQTKQQIDQSTVMPWVRFNEDEEELAPNAAGLKKEISTWRQKFVTGDKDIESDAEWAEYLRILEEAGLQQYLQAVQHCYDRMYPNGHVSK